jgi:hypothetical protein
MLAALVSRLESQEEAAAFGRFETVATGQIRLRTCDEAREKIVKATPA